MKEYYPNGEFSKAGYTIYKYESGGFLIVPTEVNKNYSYINLIKEKNIFDLRKMSKKEILFYCDEINKFVDKMNKMGLVQLPFINMEKIKAAEMNNNSKQFEDALTGILEDVNKINTGISKCDNIEKSIGKMFEIVVSNISDLEFLKWIKHNYSVCYSCDNFEQVKLIYRDQKNMVDNEASANKERVNLNNVDSMPQKIDNITDKNIETQVNLSMHTPNMTLDQTGLDSTSQYDNSSSSFIMNNTGSNPNGETVITPKNNDSFDEDGRGYGQKKSKAKTLVKSGGRFGFYPEHNENQDWHKAAFANWYGIILTLIFSFVIGYLIAWIILKVK